MFWFLGEVGEFGGAGLHLIGHLVGADAGGDFRVADLFVVGLIEVVDEVERLALGVGIDAGGVGDIEHGLAFAAEGDALIRGREESAAPECRAAAGAHAALENDKGREIFGLAAQAVSDPCAHRRAADEGEPDER